MAMAEASLVHDCTPQHARLANQSKFSLVDVLRRTLQQLPPTPLGFVSRSTDCYAVIDNQDTSVITSSAAESAIEQIEPSKLPGTEYNSLEFSETQPSTAEPSVLESSIIESPSEADTITPPVTRSPSTAKLTNDARDTTLVIVPQKTVFFVHQIYIAPNMVLTEEHQAIWNNQIREPLRKVLHYRISQGSCLQEFLTAGKDKERLKPTVIITCGDKKVKKQVEKVLKDLWWLRDILKRHQINLVAITDPFRKAAGMLKIKSASILDEPLPAQATGKVTEFWLEELGNNGEMLGRRLKLSNGRTSSIGGIVMIDDAPYALTAKHVFDSESDAHGDQDLPQQGSDQALSVTTTYPCREPHVDENDEDDASDADEPFWLGADDDMSQSSHSSQSSFPRAEAAGKMIVDNNFEHDEGRRQDHDSSSDGFPVFSPRPCRQRVIKSDLEACDWAAIALTSVEYELMNRATPQASGKPVWISMFAVGESHGDVQVTIAGKSYRGELHSSLCTIQIDTMNCDAQLIVMDDRLPMGCSGSWVTCGGQLLGHIFAVRDHMPWVYMIPIQDTLRDMMVTFCTNNIRLPSVDDAIKSVPASSTVSNPVDTIRSERLIKFPVATSECHISSEKVDDPGLSVSTDTGRRIESRQQYNDIDPIHVNTIPDVEAAVFGSSTIFEAKPLPDAVSYRRPFDMPLLSTWPPRVTGITRRHRTTFLLQRPLLRLWRTFERHVIITELRRQQRHRPYQMPGFLGLSPNWLPPNITGFNGRPLSDDLGLNLQTILKNVLIQFKSWTFAIFIYVPIVALHKSLVALAWIVLWLTYYVTWPVHGPCRLWVLQRHRNVLLDHRTLEDDHHWSTFVLEDILREDRLKKREGSGKGRMGSVEGNGLGYPRVHLPCPRL